MSGKGVKSTIAELEKRHRKDADKHPLRKQKANENKDMDAESAGEEPLPGAHGSAASGATVAPSAPTTPAAPADFENMLNDALGRQFQVQFSMHMKPLVDQVTVHHQQLRKHEERLEAQHSEIENLKKEMASTKARLTKHEVTAVPRPLTSSASLSLPSASAVSADIFQKLVIGGWSQQTQEQVRDTLKDLVRHLPHQPDTDYQFVGQPVKVVILRFSTTDHRDEALNLVQGHLREGLYAAKAQTPRRLARNRMLRAMQSVIEAENQAKDSLVVNYKMGEIFHGTTSVALLRDNNVDFILSWNLTALKTINCNLDIPALNKRAHEAFTTQPKKYDWD